MYKLLNNWKVVLLSLGGATTFWFFNALNKDYNAVISYPIEFQFARDSVVVMEPLPSEVLVDVSSGGWNLIRNTFFFNVTPVQVELDNPTEISYLTRSALFPLVEEQLTALEVNYLVTDTLHINIEKRKKRILPVKVDSLAVSLEKGFRIDSRIIVDPDTVMLEGPASFIDSIGAHYAIRLSQKEIDDPFDSKVNVNNPNTKLIKILPEEVEVIFDVLEYERLGFSLPIEMLNFPDDSSVLLTQNEVDVFFTVPKSKKGSFDVSDFGVTVDYAMLDQKDSTVFAMLMYYPESVTEVVVLPENIKVNYAQ